MKNKTISTKSSILIISVLSLLVSLYTLDRISIVEKQMSQEVPGTIQRKAVSVPENNCIDHAYTGMAEISVWPVVKNDKALLEVPADNMELLPMEGIKNFQLIDSSPALEKKIANGSENKPAKIKISGFAVLCNGLTLASLEYEDGIFRPYIEY